MTKKITFQLPESRHLGLLMDEAAMQQQHAEWASEDRGKLIMLCEQYGITGQDMLYGLALMLARKLHPEPKKRGRRSKWDDCAKGVLVVEIERLVKPDDLTHGVEWACQQLASREPWASFIEGNDDNGDPAEVLRQVYYASKNNKWTAIARDAFRLHKHEGTEGEWGELFVMDIVRKLPPD